MSQRLTPRYSVDTNQLPLRKLTVEQWVPRWFSFDKDSSQQGHQEQDKGSDRYNCPGAVRSKTGRRSRITVNTQCLEFPGY